MNRREHEISKVNLYRISHSSYFQMPKVELQVDNTIQYGEDADVRTHDFEPAENAFDSDRLLGEGG